LAQYKTINEDVVETLFSFIKFESFKEKMLAFKRGIKDEALKEADETALPMQKMVGKSHEELIKLFEELNAEDTSDPKNKWKKTLQIIEKPGEGIGC
jgi:hypothetical protein